MSLHTRMRRADFSEAADYSCAKASHCPMSVDDIDNFVGLAGDAGAVLSAVWGTRLERHLELEAEIRAANALVPGRFVMKLPARSGSTGRVMQAGSTLLTAQQIGEALSASQFARERGWLLDFSIAISPSKIGVHDPADVEVLLRRYLKNVSQYMRDNGLPLAFVLIVENSPLIGLHFHAALNAPVDCRVKLTGWHEKFLRREAKQRATQFDADVLEFSRHRKRHALLHDILLGYALKGHDPDELVQSALVSPNGGAVTLGDILPYPFRDPGVVPFERLHVGAGIGKAARGSWLSNYERGARSVDTLYAKQFVAHVHRKSIPPPPSEENAVALWTRAHALFAAGQLADGAGNLVSELCGRNVELVAHALERLAFDLKAFVDADYGVPRQRALVVLRLSIESTHSLAAGAGGRAVEIALCGQLPRDVANAVGGALVRAEEAVREMGARLGEQLVRPSWVLQWDVAVLARI